MAVTVSPSNQFESNDSRYRCCCLHITTGALIVATIELFLCTSALITIIVISSTGRLSSNESLYVFELALPVLVSVLHIFTAILVLIGIRERRPQFILPYLVIKVLLLFLIGVSVLVCLVVGGFGSKLLKKHNRRLLIRNTTYINETYTVTFEVTTAGTTQSDDNSTTGSTMLTTTDNSTNSEDLDDGNKLETTIVEIYDVIDRSNMAATVLVVSIFVALIVAAITVFFLVIVLRAYRYLTVYRNWQLHQEANAAYLEAPTPDLAENERYQLVKTKSAQSLKERLSARKEAQEALKKNDDNNNVSETNETNGSTVEGQSANENSVVENDQIEEPKNNVEV